MHDAILVRSFLLSHHNQIHLSMGGTEMHEQTFRRFTECFYAATYTIHTICMHLIDVMDTIARECLDLMLIVIYIADIGALVNF